MPSVSRQGIHCQMSSLLELLTNSFKAGFTTYLWGPLVFVSTSKKIWYIFLDFLVSMMVYGLLFQWREYVVSPGVVQESLFLEATHKCRRSNLEGWRENEIEVSKPDWSSLTLSSCWHYFEYPSASWTQILRFLFVSWCWFSLYMKLMPERPWLRRYGHQKAVLSRTKSTPSGFSLCLFMGLSLFK